MIVMSRYRYGYIVSLFMWCLFPCGLFTLDLFTRGISTCALFTCWKYTVARCPAIVGRIQYSFTSTFYIGLKRAHLRVCRTHDTWSPLRNILAGLYRVYTHTKKDATRILRLRYYETFLNTHSQNLLSSKHFICKLYAVWK